MKCTVCVDRSCQACRKAKQDTTGVLRDGAYPNATVIVRGGRIAAVRPGTNVFHSFSELCAPTVTIDGVEEPSAATVLLQSSDCISVVGRGNSSNPYKFNPVLNPRDFVCSAEGITLRQPYVAPVTPPRAYITSVTTATPDVISIDVDTNGALSVDVGTAALGVGTTRYVTYVRGTCQGPYPVWVVFVGGVYVLNVGTAGSSVNTAPPGLEPTPLPGMSFPSLAAAITAADAVPLISDCDTTGAGGA